MGWSAAAAGFFCGVRRWPPGAEQRVLYHHDEDPALAAAGGVAPAWEHFDAVLNHMGLSIPASMRALVERDAAHHRAQAGACSGARA